MKTERISVALDAPGALARLTIGVPTSAPQWDSERKQHVESGHTRLEGRTVLEIVTPSGFEPEGGGYYPAESIQLTGHKAIREFCEEIIAVIDDADDKPPVRYHGDVIAELHACLSDAHAALRNHPGGDTRFPADAERTRIALDAAKEFLP